MNLIVQFGVKRDKLVSITTMEVNYCTNSKWYKCTYYSSDDNVGLVTVYVGTHVIQLIILFDNWMVRIVKD